MSAIHGRIKKLYRHKSKWARKAQFESFRLYDRDIPDYPYIVDLHGPFCIIYKREIDRIDEHKNHLPQLLEAIYEVCGIDEDKIFIKERKIQDENFQYDKGDEGAPFISQEGPLKFKLLLNKYIDTGLFLDHRPLRQFLAEQELQNMNVLNLFCYTGSLSVASAHAGASVTSVDMSNTYLKWAQENFKLNELTGEHLFLREDVTKFLKEAASTSAKRYDVIILDPPSMSKSKKMEKLFDVQSDHALLIHNCCKLLNENGTLYFSNNLRSFKLAQEILDKYVVKDMTKWSIPQDFHDPKIHQLYKIHLRS